MEKDNRLNIMMAMMILMFIALIAVPLFVFESFKQTTNRVLAPIEDVNSQMRTQVSQLMNPTPTILPDPITIIYEVRSLSRLETIQYSVEKIITAELGQNEFKFLFGDRLLFVAHGTVIAGIDLGRISPQDIWVEGDTLYLRLPEAEIFIVALNNEKSYVYDRALGMLTRGDTNLETTARKVAEDEIRKSAIEDDILEKARQNANLFLSGFLRYFGYNNVMIVLD